MRLFTTLCYNFAVSAVFDSRRLHGQNGSQVFVTWELFCFNEFTVTRTVTRGPSKLPEFQYAQRSQTANTGLPHVCRQACGLIPIRPLRRQAAHRTIAAREMVRARPGNHADLPPLRAQSGAAIRHRNPRKATAFAGPSG